MTGDRRTRRPRSISLTPERSGLEDRLADLEDRVMRAESRRPTMQSARGWFDQLMPPEAAHHFRTAMREQLLGVRSLVDHWIGRMEREPRSTDREEIRID